MGPENAIALYGRIPTKRAISNWRKQKPINPNAPCRPARPARKNVPNPFKPGEVMDVARKPATTRVKVLPLKKLKEFAL